MISNAVNLPTSSRKHFWDQIGSLVLIFYMCLWGSVFFYPKQKVIDIKCFFCIFQSLGSIIHSGLVFIWYFMYSACTVYWCRPFKAALIFILKWFRRKNLRRIITALNMQTKCHILVYTSSILENNIVLFFFCEYGFSLTFSKNLENLFQENNSNFKSFVFYWEAIMF